MIVNRQKKESYTQFLMPLPQALLNFLDRLLTSQEGSLLEDDFDKLMNLVSVYASRRAIAAAEVLQQEFRSWRTGQQTNRYRMIAAYGLLVTAIKYEVTGIFTKPDQWFRVKVSDYELTNPIFIVETNKLAEELKFPGKYKI